MFKWFVVFSLWLVFYPYPQGLWVERDVYNSNLADGSTVSVVFDVDFDINLRNNLIKELGDFPASREISEKFLDFLPTPLGQALAENNNKQIENSKRITGSLAGTLNNYNPINDTYQINISRNFFVNGESETLALNGTVRQDSISEDGIVPSSRIANVNFVFNSLSDTFTITPDDIDNFDLSPTGITNENNNILNNNKRQEIFIKYFNWILKNLFN